MAKITFLGATGTVTGSKFLLDVDNFRCMVDCGLFQGLKALRLRNWEDFPVDPASIDCIIITHAHIDHTGYLPRMVRKGFTGPIITTTSTADLCGIMLPDSAHLQEEDAKYANHKKFSKHDPALPLYTVEDAHRTLEFLEPMPYGKTRQLTDKLALTFRDAGHILGSAFVDLRISKDGKETRVLFSGDLGRPAQPILRDPHTVFGTDYLILESTYGDRLHGKENIHAELARVIRDSVERGGVLVIPSFAVGRTQELLYTIRELEEAEQIPQLPIYMDSPMAISTTSVFSKNQQDHDLESKVIELDGRDILRTAQLQFVKSPQQSKSLNQIKRRAIIISASGMVTGGRILHHLFHRLPNPKTTVLFIGYQAQGTRGRKILEGSGTVKIHGQHVPINAHIENIGGFSAHADYNEILAWLSSFNEAPKKVFLVHGEPEPIESLRQKITGHFGWPVEVPEYLSEFELDCG